MRHRCGYRRLGLESGHRRLMLRNLSTSMIIKERIKTTLAQAKETRRIVERMVTLGKRGDLHARRLASSYLLEKDAVGKLFSDLATRFKQRPGGYTRIIKAGPRFGDSAQLAFLEFVDFEVKATGAEEKKSAKTKS